MDRCIAHGVRFHQAKVAKVVHNEASSLLICDDGVAVPATVVLDATGFSRCLVQYDKPYNPGYQVAYGILAEVDEHPFDIDKMLFMDWRDSHLPEGSAIKERNSRVPTFLYAMPFSPTRIFLEETSLVARPGLSMDDIQERMAARLRHLGIRIRSVEEDEGCVIPMGGPLPVLPQRVPHYWHGFLSSRLFLPELLMFGLSLFAHASNTSKLEIMAKGTVPLAKMVGNLIQDKDRQDFHSRIFKTLLWDFPVRYYKTKTQMEGKGH
ncbi:Lycopene beta cyclase, chloroplastic/chromoplastic [Triticum urartu]|uniref:Lycopene beta cyclase, chloroplastic/chromoplastic n=1 Tax=Triticum urartu TaxID=4572 RepID=M7ZUM0_TRIUA|nr:Lycopene beta cyclase, chloroplastic/chromoplastic [Triticum urartu]